MPTATLSPPPLAPPSSAPAFDVDGARKAGYSDDDILQHLTASRRFDIQGALSSGYSKGDIIDHLAAAPTTAAPVYHPGFLESAWNTLKAMPGGILNTVMHPIDSSEIGQYTNSMNSITPEEWKKANADSKARANGNTKAGMKGTPPTDTEWPTAAEYAGKLAGQSVGDAAMIALADGLGEAPYGRIGTAIKAAAPDVATGTAKTAAGAAIGHFLPNEAYAGIYPLLKGGKDIASGISKGIEAYRGPVLGPETMPKGYKSPYYIAPAGSPYTLSYEAQPKLVPGEMSGKPSTPGLSNVPHREPYIPQTSNEFSPSSLVAPEAPAVIEPSKPPMLPDLRSSSYQPLSKPPAPIDPIDTNALFQQQFGRPPQGPQLSPIERPTAPVDLSKVVLPDWYGTPKPSASVATAPTELLDQVAQGFGYKKFSAIKDPKAASTVRNLASQVSTQDFTPPGTAGVLAPDVHPVATPTIQPIAGGAAPAGNNIVYPESVHQQLRPAGPDVAITHASNASAKDLAVAGRLKQSGITLPAFDAMTDAELNQHYKALGYKNLGSDYAPGKRVGRDAATGRAHLRQVLSELQ